MEVVGTVLIVLSVIGGVCAACGIISFTLKTIMKEWNL